MASSGTPRPVEAAVALVTGASRGVGRGIAAALAQAGLTVYATGRQVESAELPPEVARIACDHTHDEEVEAAFARVEAQSGRLDILVNNAWGGYERMAEDGEFTWSKPFWLQPRWRWDAMMTVGVRGAFVASQLAARMMLPHRRGLIVNISFWAARKHIANALYGCAKAATDKLTADAACELAPHGITVVALYPGLVRTEAVLRAAAFLDLSNAESPEFIGRAIHALACDPESIQRTGQALVAAQLALDYGFTDVDGRRPRPLGIADV